VLPVGTPTPPPIFPAGLIFTGVAGVTPGSQDVTIGNLTAATNSFLSAPIGTGFTYAPTASSLVPNQPATVRVYPDFTTIAPGTIQQGTIALQFGDRSQQQLINILFVVAPAGTAAPNVAQDASGHSLPDEPLASSPCSQQPLQLVFRTPQPSFATFAAVVGQTVTIEVQVSDGCGNLVGPAGQNAQVNYFVPTASGPTAMTHIGNGVWQGSWMPVSAGSVPIAVVALLGSNGLVVGGETPTLTAAVTQPPAATATPLLTAQYVAHAASDVFGQPIAPGELITIYGTNLADGNSSGGLPLPQQAEGAQVFLGNQSLPILFTSSGQLNVQVPYTVPVNTPYQLIVQHGTARSIPQSIVVAQAEPGIFTTNQAGSGQGDILRSDQVTLAQPGTPAAIGEAIVIYCTGLGTVTGNVAAGQAAPSSPPAATMNPVTVTIGGQIAQVLFEGLAPGFAGLYQVNAVVPSGITTGNSVPVTLTVAGQISPPVTMAVQ